MMSASPISLAAPAISLRMSTPVWSGREAMNSLATRFMPSRKGVIRATSQARYIATISSKPRLRY